MTKRQMATIRRVAEVKDIEGADLIQAYRVDGWWVVSQKDQYKVGDLVVYCEIDSWIPHELAPFLSRGKEPREYNGIKGERLRTIKLRGQISQGLLLPLDKYYSTGPFESIECDEGDDVSDLLNITKWELSEKEFIKKYQSNPEAREGGFPWFIPKSDQERIQNIKDKQIESWKNITFEVTEKLEGSSMTVYYINNPYIQDEGVCSRNINLKEDEDNRFWIACNKYNLLRKLKSTGLNLAIQGELIGPGVQGNYYDLDELEFYCYNIWDIDNQVWLKPSDRIDLCLSLDIKHVPIHYTHFGFHTVFDIDDPSDLRECILDLADGVSVINSKKKREGLVFKSNETTDQFKAVSNDYLLGEK